MPFGVVTTTVPVVAPVGTLVVISIFDALKVAGVPLKVTLVAPFRLFPRITTVAPTLPDMGFVWTNGPSPTDRLKTVPQPGGQSLDPPWLVVPYNPPSVPCASPPVGLPPSGQRI